MTTTELHIQDMQDILDAAKRSAKDAPTTANIAAVERARKALETYQSRTDGADRYRTQAAALEYLQRTWQIQKSKLSKDVNDGKVPRKDGYYTAKDLDYYAQACNLTPLNSHAAQPDGLSDEIKRETARKLRIQNEEREGLLINKAEEEARDAKLWGAIKADIENNGQRIVHELINRILPIVSDDDLRARILNLNHELRIVYEDAVADVFDRYAIDGGVEV